MISGTYGSVTLRTSGEPTRRDGRGREPASAHTPVSVTAPTRKRGCSARRRPPTLQTLKAPLGQVELGPSDWTGPETTGVVPNIRETLALCYLGCVLLREPVRIGDICKWVRADQMPYFAAVRIPRPTLASRFLQVAAQPSSYEPKGTATGLGPAKVHDNT